MNCGASHGEGIDVQRGEWRASIGGNIGIVITDDRKVFRYPFAQILRGADRGAGNIIIDPDQGGNGGMVPQKRGYLG